MLIHRIKRYIIFLLETLGKRRRKKHIARLQKYNYNKTPTIISNNCIAGIIYHDLGLPFLSPTINLMFGHDDYMEFINNLEHYINCIPEEAILADVAYPVGTLTRNNKTIYIHFVHYSSFEEAKYKWVERSKRVDFNNLYVIFEYNIPGYDRKKIVDIENPYYQQFKLFPYKKRMITYSSIKHDKELVNSSCYKNNYSPGKLLKYPKLYSKKRYLNCLDYNEFFNN